MHSPIWIFAAISIEVAILLICNKIVPNCKSFHFDPKGRTGAFSDIVANYMEVVKLAIGLASGTITVLLTAIFIKNATAVLIHVRPAMIFLCFCIFYGLFFMALIAFFYEGYRHDENSYHRWKYLTVLSLGWSALLSFFLGYVSLVLALG